MYTHYVAATPSPNSSEPERGRTTYLSGGEGGTSKFGATQMVTSSSVHPPFFTVGCFSPSAPIITLHVLTTSEVLGNSCLAENTPSMSSCTMLPSLEMSSLTASSFRQVNTPGSFISSSSL